MKSSGNSPINNFHTFDFCFVLVTASDCAITMTGKRIWQTDFDLRKLLIPRPLAWLTTPNDAAPEVPQQSHLILVSGFTSACYSPLTVLLASPSTELLTVGRHVTLSLTTIRETEALESATVGQPLSFEALGLTPAQSQTLQDITYPPAVADSPVQFYGTVQLCEKDLVLILIATSVVDRSVLAAAVPTPSSTRQIKGKIDARRIDAIVDLGGGRYRPNRDYRSMPRPTRADEESSWTTTDFTAVVPETPLLQQHDEDSPLFKWTPSIEGRSCALGFNPTTALVLSRPIGWISTYSSPGRVAHLAPYSFFMDVGPDLVAFCPYSAAGTQLKDAHKDAQDSKCFCYNMCTMETATAMNLSAAPLAREESEFALAGLTPGIANTIDAPVVAEAPVRFECEYVKTINDIGGFSIVIGRVKGVSVEPEVLLPDGTLNLEKVHPIARLGYMDEYGVL